jgi:hypothetical protein
MASWSAAGSSTPFDRLRAIGSCAASAHPELVEGAPTRFNAQGQVTARANSIGNPLQANELSRLKKKWRKEWEAERLAEDQASEADTFAEIDALIDQMRERTLAAMSAKTRQLYEAYLESQREDAEGGVE